MPAPRGNEDPVALGLGLGAFPAYRGLSRRRTSKSAPVGPRDVVMETVAGMLSFGATARLGCVEKASRAVRPRRSTSYPARTKRPSGGTKESSPGRSFHLFKRTQG